MYRLIFLFIIIFSTFPCYAAELHVGSEQTYSNIASAITASSSGDTIYVHAGTYNEQNLSPKAGIDNDNRTIISGYPLGTYPVIDAEASSGTRIAAFDITNSYITLQYLDVRGGGGSEGGSITVASSEYGGSGTSSYITINHCKISDTNTGGTTNSYNPAHIRLSYGLDFDHVVISNCELSGEYAAGIVVYADNHGNHLTINNNYMHSVVHGIAFKWGDDDERYISVYNNIIQDVSERAIYLDQSLTSITNNIIDTSAGGITFGDNWGGSNSTVSHNTFYGVVGNVYDFKTGDDNTCSYNIRYYTNSVNVEGGATGNDYSSDFIADPLFTNAVAHDFSLSAGSEAIGTADNGSDYGADLTFVGIDAGVTPNLTGLKSLTGGTLQ